MGKLFSSKSSYTSNLRNSAKNFTKDFFGRYMPTITTSTYSTTNAIMDIKRDSIRNRSRIGVLVKDTWDKTIGYIGDTFNNAKEQLKTGNLFTKNSMSAIDSLMTDYSEDDYGDSESTIGEIAQNLDNSENLRRSVEATGSVISEGIGHLGEIINTKETESAVRFQKFQTENSEFQSNMLSMFKGYMGMYTENIAPTITKIPEIGNSLLEKQDKIIEKLSEINEKIIDISNGITQRTGKDSDRGLTLIEKIFSGSNINYNEYIQSVKKNISDQGSMVTMALGQLGGVFDEFKSNPIGMLLSGAGSMLLPKTVKSELKRIESTSKGFAGYALQGLYKMRDSSNPILQKIGQILGVDITNPSINTSTYKDEKLTLAVENKKNKAITEIIPQYLSEITNALTGKHKIFDYDIGKFVNVKDAIKKSKEDERSAYIYSMNGTRDYFVDALKSISNDVISDDDKKFYREDIDEFLYFISRYGDNFNLLEVKYKDAKEAGLKLRGGEKSYKLIQTLFKSIPKDKRSILNQERIASAAEMRAYIANRTSQLNKNGLMALKTGFYDEDTKPQVQTAPLKGSNQQNSTGGKKFKLVRNADDLKKDPEHKVDLKSEFDYDRILYESRYGKNDSVSDYSKALKDEDKKAERSKIYGDFETDESFADSFKDYIFEKLNFDISDHKFLNNMIGEKGVLPKIISIIPDTMIDLMYGDTSFSDVIKKSKSSLAKFKGVAEYTLREKDHEELADKIFGSKEEGGEAGILNKAEEKGKASKKKINEFFEKIKKTEFYEEVLEDPLRKLNINEIDRFKRAIYEFSGGTPQGLMSVLGKDGSNLNNFMASNNITKKVYKVSKVETGAGSVKIKRKDSEVVPPESNQFTNMDTYFNKLETFIQSPNMIHKVSIVDALNQNPLLVRIYNPKKDAPIKSVNDDTLIDSAEEEIKRQQDKDPRRFEKIKDAGFNHLKHLFDESLLSDDYEIKGFAEGGDIGDQDVVVGENAPEILRISKGGGKVLSDQRRPLHVTIDGLNENAQKFFGKMAGFLASYRTGDAEEFKKSADFTDTKSAKKRKFTFIRRKAKIEEDGEEINETQSDETKPPKKPKSEFGQFLQEDAKTLKGRLFASISRLQEIAKSGESGSVIGSIMSSAIGLGPIPGMIVGSLMNGSNLKDMENKERVKAKKAGEKFDDAAWEVKKENIKGMWKSSAGGAAIGAVGSSILGLGPIPGILIGSMIGKQGFLKKKDTEEAKKAGKEIDDNKETNIGKYLKDNPLKPYAKPAIGGAIASSMLGLGPLPGIIIGTVLKNKKLKKKEQEEAKKLGQEVEETTGEKSLKDKVMDFIRGNAVSITVGASVSTMLGMGPLPGAMLTLYMNKRKEAKKQAKEAEKVAKDVEDATNPDGKITKKFSIKDKIGKFFKKGKNIGVWSLASTVLGLGPIPGIMLGTILNNRSEKLQKEADDAEAEAKNVEEAINTNTEPPTGKESKKEKVKSKLEKAKSKLEEEKEKRKKKALDRKNQNLSKKLLDNAKQGDSANIIENVSDSLNESDTDIELTGLEKSTSIMSNAASLATKSKDIENITKTSNDKDSGGLLSSLLGLGGGKLKALKPIWDFIKTNFGTMAAGASLLVGAKNIKSGAEQMQSDEAIDKSEGSGTMGRGVVQATSGALRLTGEIAKAVTSPTKSKSLLGKVSQWIAKAIKAVSKKVSKSAGKVLSNSADNIASKIISKFSTKLAPKAANFLTKWSNPIGWTMVIAQCVYDFGTGMADVKNIMKLDTSYDPPLKLKITAGVCKLLSGLLLGIISVEWLTDLIFGIIGTDAEKEELAESKAKQKSEYEAFIKEHPEAIENGLTEEKFNSIQNKSTWTKFVEWLPFTKKASLDSYTNGGTTVINNTTNVIASDTLATEIEDAEVVKESGRGTLPKKYQSILNNAKSLLNKYKNKLSGTKKSNIVDNTGRGVFDNIFSTVRSWFNDEGVIKKESIYNVSDVPYYSQKDPKWANKAYGYYNGLPDNIEFGGCGPTVAAMMKETITGKKTTPKEMAAEAMAGGFKANGTSTRFFEKLGEEMGVEMAVEHGLTSDALTKMKNNVPVAMIGRDPQGLPPYGPGNHYILGIDANERGIVIYDPQDASNNKRYSYQALANATNTTITPQIDPPPYSDEGSGARGSVNIPVDTARSALNSKNKNRMNTAFKDAEKAFNFMEGRGDDDDVSNSTFGQLLQIQKTALNAIQTISETLLRIEEYNMKAEQGNSGNSSSSSTTSYSSKQDSSLKSSLYSQAVKA